MDHLVERLTSLACFAPERGPQFPHSRTHSEEQVPDSSAIFPDSLIISFDINLPDIHDVLQLSQQPATDEFPRRETGPGVSVDVIQRRTLLYIHIYSPD